MKKNEYLSPEEAMKQVQKIFKERGTKALEMAKKEILKEQIECKEAREALNYFMTKYWHDTARPALMSLVCEAVGGDPERITPIAVPLILISGAVDIHDDILDQSKLKDGRLTVYGKYGKDIALLIGDALLFKGLILLNRVWTMDVPPAKINAIIGIVKNMFFELGVAEAKELAFKRRLDVSPDDYVKVIWKKAADVEAHTRISALVSDASRTEVEALGKYGRLLGMLIILRDDWIDMIDFDEAKHRYQYESLPLPMLYAAQDSNAKRQVSSILMKGKLSIKDAQTIWGITKNSGGMKRYMETMKNLKIKAQSKLGRIKKETTQLTLLLECMIPPIETKESTTTKV